MKWQIILLSALIVFMSFPTVWADEQTIGTSESQISTSTAASITPLMKVSSGSRSSSSSSSSKTKVKTDGDDDDVTTTGNETDSSGGFPWWIFLIIGIVILAIIGIVVWYLFLR